MRIALSLGMHRSTSSIHTNAVERESRRRIWWSLYLFDRLTCSKLGQPISVDDDVIDVELPTMDGLTTKEQELFADPSHLCASVGLARITGNICRQLHATFECPTSSRGNSTPVMKSQPLTSVVSDIYCLPGRKRGTFVQRVHRILSSLRHWDATAPEHLAFRWDDSNRHVASLHLCYNQCITHTTRPILLHIFRTKFRLSSDPRLPAQTAPVFSPTTLALADSCINAARMSNKILSKLFVDGTLATLGYWDAHYLFSSTLILIMSEVMEPNPAVCDAVQTAFSLLASMRDDGNVPASDFYDRLTLIRASVSELGTRTGRDTDASSTAKVRTSAAANNHQEAQPTGIDWTGAAENSYSTGLESCRLDDLDALANPYIDDFLAEKSFEWSSTSFPNSSTLQQLANELGDSFSFPDANVG